MVFDGIGIVDDIVFWNFLVVDVEVLVMMYDESVDFGEGVWVE